MEAQEPVRIAGGSFTLFEALFAIALMLAIIIPSIKILRRMGFSGWWVVVSFLPFVNILQLWYLALAEWPNE